MEGFKGSDRVSEHYDTNAAFAGALNAVVPGFEYPDWSHLTIAQVFSRLSVPNRGRVEDALNGWSLSDKKLTARQGQFVSEHSGELRSDLIRESIARIGTEAMALIRLGDEATARKLMMDGGLSDATTNLLLLGWKHENIEHVLDEQPAVCCVVNAVAHKTYVGRIVQITDRAVWQEVEPGQIVEHALGAFGDDLKRLEAAYFELPSIIPHFRPEAIKNRLAEDGWREAIAEQINGWGVVTKESHRVTLIKDKSLVCFAPEGADFNNPVALSDAQLAQALAAAKTWAVSNDAISAQALEERKTAHGELVNPWRDSWCIAYAGGGKATVKTASLMLLDGNSVKPNAFEGRVVSETGARFVQENESNVYAGHLKSMTGELDIGEHYSIRYRGAMGQQVAEVNGKVVENGKSTPSVDAIEQGVTDYCGQVCGGGQCGSGPVCHMGIDTETHMPSGGTQSELHGEVGKHDWCIGEPSEDGYAVFVDDRQLSYRATVSLARGLAQEVIADIQADGDYRLNDRPSGFLPPKQNITNSLSGDAAAVVRTDRVTTLGAGDALSIGMEIFKKLSVVVTPHDIAACLTGKRANSSFSGRILDVDEERGLVVQSCGRQAATVHRLGDFAEVPKVKDMMDVKYQGGLLAAVVKEVGPVRGVGR